MSYRSWVFLVLLSFAGSASAKKPLPSPPPSEPPEKLAQADIMAVVLQHKPDIVACVKAQKRADEKTNGKLQMSWIILTSGKTADVKCVSPELCQTVMADCLTKSIEGWAFPQAKKQGAPIVFPFVF
jgi:hypothetical protein